MSAGKVQLTEIGPDSIHKSQPYLLTAKAHIWGRLLAMRLFGMPTPSFKNFNLFELWQENLGIKEKAVSVLGTMRRIVQRRLRRGETI